MEIKIAGKALKITFDEIPWDLVLAMGMGLMLFALILLTHPGPLRTALGLVLAFFLPGYAVVSALFPTAGNIDTIERVALSIGTSICTVPLIGMVLNFSPWGIGLYPVIASLVILVIISCILAWIRRSMMPLNTRFRVKPSITLPTKQELLTIDNILTILIVISVIIAVYSVTYIFTHPQQGEEYTEFYVFDENRTTEDYPKNLTVGESGTVIVGIACHEYRETMYTVEIRLLNHTGERENLTLKWYNLSLNQDQYYETDFTFDISRNGTYKMIFFLYIDDVEEPYRDLHLWIRVRS